jgi:hypothetical protein
VQHQPEIPIHTDSDAFADAPQFAHSAAFHLRNRRFHSAQQKHVRETHSLDRLADDTWFQRADIGGDIGQLRHGDQLADARCTFATFSCEVVGCALRAIMRSFHSLLLAKYLPIGFAVGIEAIALTPFPRGS